MLMPQRQQGQSLLVLVVLLGALLSALWWTTEAGSAVNEKQRLANAADAAALSAAVWQARALNFDAYTNRAIVANEAALAQSVSLRSWSSHMTRLLPGAALVTAWVPYLNSAMMTLQRAFMRVQGDLRAGRSRVEALKALAERLDSPAVTALVAALIQADSSGGSLADVLRAQSEQRLDERFARAEKAAMEAPVKMLGPLVLCIFPCTFIVLAAPIVLRFVDLSP